MRGINADDRSGSTVSGAGDVNGDGIDDLIIGASGADPNGLFSGQTYVVFGQPGAFPADFELSSLLAVNGGDGSAGFALNGVSAGDQSGSSVSGAGDVNADGYDDLIISSRFVDAPGGGGLGQSYLVFGSGAGFPAEFELSSLLSANDGDGSLRFVINNRPTLSGRRQIQ